MNLKHQTTSIHDDQSIQQGRAQLELARWLTSLAGQPKEFLEQLAQDFSSLKGQAARKLLQGRL
ncbi:MAG: hypothetical protein ACFFGZ_11000 [Candidatus Thorarchaeota archaeon]